MCIRIANTKNYPLFSRSLSRWRHSLPPLPVLCNRMWCYWVKITETQLTSDLRVSCRKGRSLQKEREREKERERGGGLTLLVNSNTNAIFQIVFNTLKQCGQNFEKHLWTWNFCWLLVSVPLFLMTYQPFWVI